MLFKMSFSDAISINEDERIYKRVQYKNAGMPETTSSILRVGEGSAVLGIRVGVSHLTKFDVGGVRRWRRFDIRGLMHL